MPASTKNRPISGAAQDPPRPLNAWLLQAVESRGSHVALEAVDAHYTYAQLGAQVQALAQTLAQAGVAPGDRVAIAAERDAQTIIAILAVVHAGAAYVPLDLSYPAERLRAMLEASQPTLVLGSAQALGSLKTLAGEFPTLAAPAKRSAAPYAAQAGLTYVLFTSGSTGTPKGVAMGDEPLRHLIEWHATHRTLGTAARTLQFAPLSFDVHFQEIFSSIACGGTLVLIPEHHRRDPALLVKALAQKQIQRIFVPYIALQMIADAAQGTQLALQDVVSAGEQLQITPSIRQLFMRHRGARLHNHYGPTESHVVTAYELQGDAGAWPEIPPIGLPLPHVQIMLRGESGAIDPRATDGELLLGGQTLAYGYLGKPDLSRERFQAVPEQTGLWYLTGDLVRRTSDGVLTYLGRADQQLKVDGFRVEPGEIELAIMAHPAIKDAVVTAPEVPGSGKQLVAHLVCKDHAADAASIHGTIRAHLRGRLPDYMVPVRFIVLQQLPTTPSGKIDRRALPLPPSTETSSGGTPLQLVRAAWQELLGLEAIDEHQNLFDIGARSLLVMRFIAKLQASAVQKVSVADVYDRPTIAGIVEKIGGAPDAARAAMRSRKDQQSSAIAIVGMATRTAGAQTVEAFWQGLLDGKEGIRHFAAQELDPSIPEAVRTRPNFVAARGVVENAGRFDAAFFGISAREAVLLDPQQRMLLELAWNALEHAGIDPSRSDERIGVYAGTANNSYAPAMRTEAPEVIQQAGEFAAMLASEKDYVATRIANRLNLNGPAVSVHTACSTGLVAVAQAWQALANGQCDVALAGGATVIVPQEGGYLHVEGAMESADGHCRPFDAAASGTVFASGGAIVALKRLEDAQRDGDTIFAVIRGVGLNNDGGEKASFTAPSVRGQAAAIRMALDHAGVGARSIGYVEAHGTGTALGDPIEIAALTQAWQADTREHQYCAIGSLKSNLGHTIAAAGVLGLIKAALCVHHGVIPKTLHFLKPNPQIDFTQTPFKVVAANTPWPASDTPRRAAVSSFGVGGTNAHVVLEQAPAAPPAPESASSAAPLLLPLSAKSEEALAARAQQLADYLTANPSMSLARVSASLMRGRAPMPLRMTIAARDRQSAVAALLANPKAKTASLKPRLVFVFPGQGSQHPGMAGSLYHDSPAFREAFDQCLDAITPLLGTDLRDYLVDARPDDAKAAELLAQTKFAQPALFAMHYALTAWLDALGLRPDAMVGHSVGEYAAACRAGVMRLQDAAAMIVARGAAMFAQPCGAMLAVKTDAVRVSALLPPGAEVAGFNAPALSVVAGPTEVIDRLAQQLDAQSIESTRLKVSHAFHSAAMEGALPLVEAAARQAQLCAPSVPVYSCVSGEPLTAAEATSPAYWARQVRAPVQFTRAISAELAHKDVVFVEVGPSQALTALIRQHRTQQGLVPNGIALLGPASKPGDAALAAVQAIGALWAIGAPVVWPSVPGSRRVPLPSYPFMGETHWFKRRPNPTQASIATDTPLIAPAALAPQTTQTTASHTSMVTPMSRIPQLQQELMRLFGDVSGLAVEELSASASFTDQGLDSLSLTQATLEIERVFEIKLRFRRLLEDLDTVEKLAAYFDTQLAPEKFAPAPAAVAPAQPAATLAIAQAGTPGAGQPAPALQLGPPAQGLQQVIMQQMQIMAQQLALLSNQATPGAATEPHAVLTMPQVSPPASTAIERVPHSSAAPAKDESAAQPSAKSLVEKPFGASARITLDVKQDLTRQQGAWLGEFVQRYNARSGKSKAFSQQHRKLMADPRVVTGFNPLWKDLVYPIVAERSKGAHIWDLDGNQYIDLLSCFGANLLGYQPESLVEAMVDQLRKGIEVGPQHPMSAEVAQLISEFTGMQRVAFCNTGSEAVMGAMRIARTVTGRKTIAIFTNSYHGIFDEVIVRGTKQLRSLSAAPGILANAVENILVLDWASDESLKILRERGKELAAIMTEPVQNKYPTVQPREFLKSLRSIADDAGCALIFDEVVTGFRVAPGGAQEFYGVRADIATYGKIIGGGLPFAAIGGSAQWLDALDGGTWQYGDDSYPEAGVTYFAGTFVRHPLALAAARASLLHLKAGGPALYRKLNANTQDLIDRLNAAFAVRSAPVKAVHCASLWRLSWDDDQKFVSLFYYLARYHGLHLYEQFGHFVTEAMREAELDQIFAVFTQVLDELMALGFITPRPGVTPPGADKDKDRSSAPLTPGQTERWLAANFDANARKALNESICLSLKGDVNTTALRAAIDDVTRRHEAFRVVFDLEEPTQRLIAPSAAVDVPVIDFSGAADPIESFHEYCDANNTHEFALDQAPLAKFAIVRVAPNHVCLHVVVSHLIFDGWATPVYLKDLATAYRARVHGSAPVWPPAESALQFGAAQQSRWDSAEAKISADYWSEQLQDPPAPLQLGDKQPPALRLYSGSTIHYAFEPSVCNALRKLASENKATLFQALFSAVALAIEHLTARKDFVISVPFASQSLERHDALIADGVLDLPVRMQLNTGASFTEVLKQARTRLMDALEHPLATQGSVARALGIPSAGNRPPLTGVYFNLNPRLSVSGFEPLAAEFQEGRKLGLLSEVIFNFYEAPGSLALDLHYSTEFFSPGAAAQLLDALKGIVTSLAANQAKALAGIATLDAAPKQPLAAESAALSAADVARLERWNDTAVRYESGLRLGDLIRRSVVGQPDAIAVRFEGHSVTYAELDRMAWALAYRLREAGIKPGDLVGVCLDRSVELVVALVGVVYSGAAYVPLDPDYPAQRLTHMCEDANLRVVVTRNDELSRVASAMPSSVQTISLSEELLSAPVQSGDIIGSEDDPAYVIFTSGSTGRPKGAINSHKGVVNWLLWMQQTYALSAQDRIMQKTPYSFDVSLREFFWPLLVGAVIVVAKPGGHREANYIVSLVEAEGISVIHFVPSMLQIFLDEPDLQRCKSLRLTICSGEALPIAAVDQFFKALPAVRLVNLYGPTEAAVEVTYWECKPNDPRGIVPIGFPVANTRMYVLDETLKPVPVGAPGDLYIGGVQVGIGYANRSELTNERFLADPFTSGGRMYKTGDIARWLDDGALEYLGRSDHQVKIRGFRIELGEIEARLLEHADVARCVVIAREFGAGDMRLVAYTVAKGAEPSPQSLKSHLAAQLPEHMLPQHFVALPAIPLLPNGKIDRKALPEPAEPLGASGDAKPPRTPLEAQVAATMAEMLKLKSIGVDDNFFALGGHSLIAAKVVSQLNKRLGTQLTLRAVFEAPSAARLANAIETAQGKSSTTPQRAPIVRQTDQARAPLTLMQERIRFIEEMQPGRVVYNTPSAHRLTGKMNLQAFDRAFTTMIERQPALRTAIVETAGGYVQELQKVEFSLLPLVDLSALAPSQREADLAAQLEALVAEPFVLSRAPLFRARLFKLSDKEHVLFFMTHHIVWDGWSFDVLYSEMSALYEAYCAGRTPDIAPLTLTYADYAHWHNEWLKSQELKDQVAAWKAHFEAAPHPSRVTGDYPRELASGGVGSTEWMHFDREQAEKIRNLAKQTGSTLSMVALSVYAALMSEWMREPCPAIGMPVRGRAIAELEPIMGFFNNMLPVRLPVDRHATGLEWIAKVRTALVDVFGSQEAPFELLARAASLGQSSSAPLYQVMFSFQDARARQANWGNLAHQRVLLRQQGATEDVNLWMVEIPNGIEAGIQYNAELFAAQTIAALKHRFQKMLDALIRDPNQKVQALLQSSLPPTQPLLRLAHEQPFHPLDLTANLDIQAADHFSTIALEYAGTSLSYGQIREKIAGAQSALTSARAGGAVYAIVASGNPLAQILGCYAALAADLQVVFASTEQLSSPQFWQDRFQMQQVAVLSDTQHQPAFARSSAWLDTHALFADLSCESAVQPHSATASAVAYTGATAITRALLNNLVAGFSAHVRPLRSEAVLVPASTHAAMTVFLASLAWLHGARLRLVDSDELQTQVTSREFAGLVYADPSALERALTFLPKRAIDATFIIDVASNSVPTTQRLLQSGSCVYNIFRSQALGLPVAAGLITHARDSAVFGRPLLDRLLTVSDRGTDHLSTGLIGTLWVDAGQGVAVSEPALVRERGDGVLQFISSLSREQSASVPSTSVRVQAAANSPISLAAAPAPAPVVRAGAAGGAKQSTSQLMIAVWKEVLGVARVTEQDNFFELGGSSLSAMQAAQAVEQQLGRRISPRRYVFETLGQLAAAYDGTEAVVPEAALPAVAPQVVAASQERGLAKRFKRLVGLS